MTIAIKIWIIWIVLSMAVAIVGAMSDIAFGWSPGYRVAASGAISVGIAFVAALVALAVAVVVFA